MGLRGPAPKPEALQRIEGVDRPSRKHREVKLPVMGWEAPAHLKGEARREWKRLVGPLVKVGLLSIADRDMFATYCVWHGRHIEAEFLIAKRGMTIQTPNGLKQTSPYVTISKHASEVKARLSAELGLTPAARARMGRALGTLGPTEPPTTPPDGDDGAPQQATVEPAQPKTPPPPITALIGKQAAKPN